jgi:predicted transcriptional regulator
MIEMYPRKSKKEKEGRIERKPEEQERFQNLYQTLKESFSDLPDPIIREMILEGLANKRDDKEIAKAMERIFKISPEDLRNLVESYERKPEEIPEEEEYIPPYLAMPSEELPGAPERPEVTPEQMPTFGDVLERLRREVPESEVLKKLLESSIKIGELINRLYRVKYSPRILRKIIFTPDDGEAQELLSRLRQGEYNIPATLWRRAGLADLFHKLGIKVETKNPFESLALIAEKGRDMKKQLDELMEKILEIENRIREMKKQGLSQEQIKEELEKLTKELTPTIPNELSNIEKGIEELEKYFRGRENIFSKLKPNAGVIASSIGLWGLAIGWFLPLWLITKMYDQIEKSSLGGGKK